MSQYARYTFNYKLSHEITLKHIGGYLKGTRTKSLIMRRSKTLQVYCSVDSDFDGLWSYADSQDPTCVRSRPGFLIMIGDCPTTWSSKLQIVTALSTMETKCIALSSTLRELITFQRLLKAVWITMTVEDRYVIDIKTPVFEDNQGCLILANLESPRTIPRSKHYVLTYHSFRTQLKPNNIIIHAIDINSHLVYIYLLKVLDVYYLSDGLVITFHVLVG